MAEDQNELELGQEEPTEKEETPKDEPPKQKMVPHEALHEQRLMNKQLQQELANSRQQAERMEETFQKLLSNLNDKPAPNYEEDPLGNISARNQALEKDIKKLTDSVEGFKKETSQQRFMQQINDTLSGAEAEFRSQHPDYDQAVKYLKDVTRSDLADQGMTGPEVEQTLNAGKIGLANAAIQNGKNPAQVIYDRAKRYGFRGQEASVEEIAKGQELGKTVEGGSRAGLTLRDLAQLGEKEFEAICQDGKKFEALIKGQMVH